MEHFYKKISLSMEVSSSPIKILINVQLIMCKHEHHHSKNKILKMILKSPSTNSKKKIHSSKS